MHSHYREYINMIAMSNKSIIWDLIDADRTGENNDPDFPGNIPALQTEQGPKHPAIRVKAYSALSFAIRI